VRPGVGTDASREIWLYVAAWSTVAVGLLVGDRRFWTRPAPDAARAVGARTD
jgi:uncharacterized protein